MGIDDVTLVSECCRLCKEDTACEQFSFHQGPHLGSAGAGHGSKCILNWGDDELKIGGYWGAYIASPADISECSCGKALRDLDIFSANN